MYRQTERPGRTCFCSASTRAAAAALSSSSCCGPSSASLRGVATRPSCRRHTGGEATRMPIVFYSGVDLAAPSVPPCRLVDLAARPPSPPPVQSPPPIPSRAASRGPACLPEVGREVEASPSTLSSTTPSSPNHPATDQPATHPPIHRFAYIIRQRHKWSCCRVSIKPLLEPRFVCKMMVQYHLIGVGRWWVVPGGAAARAAG